MGGLLQNMGIMKKILAMMLMLGAVGIITTAVNAWTIRAIDLRYEELVHNRLPAITQMVRSNRMTAEVLKNAFRATMYAPGSAERQVAMRGIDERLADTQKSFDEAERRDPRLAPLISRLRGTASEIHRLSRLAVAQSNAGSAAAAMRTLAEADRLTADFGADLKRENDRRIAETEAEAADLGSAAHGNLLMALLITIAATAVALFIAHRVVRGSIVGPLLDLNGQMTELAAGNHAIDVSHAGRKDEVGTMSRSILVFRDRAEERARLEEQKKRADAEQEMVVATLGKQLDRLAGGDMDVAITEQFPESYRQLRQAFNSAVESLGGLIRSVSDSTGQIRTGSQEIAQASEDLARRTESNAASLEQTNAAIKQMDGRLKASASASVATVGRADQAIATVGGGRALADEAVSAMGRVSDSAKGIDSVIEGLDKIAFQTRVLAMNAAVEAGRAGEAGRGFAVVADLVSALAMRAEEEAKRARDQLTVTQTDIIAAVGAVEKVDSALQNISADVGEVHQLLGSMASDNQAQSVAIAEINAAVASMDQSTQQNAAMVEETSAAARNLLNEVGTLAGQAARFRCAGQSRVAAVAPVTSAPAPAPAPARARVEPVASKAAKKSAPPAKTVPVESAARKTDRPRAATLPRHGKEGGYQSPVKPLPGLTVEALTRASIAPAPTVGGDDDDDWKEF